MSKILENTPLRERKAAQTKIDLLKSMLRKTDVKKMDEISVKELCDDILISEGTFFNYFKKKSDLLIYFIKLWTIQAVYLADKKYGKSSGLKRIESIFLSTADNQTIGNNRIMYEIIAFTALEESEYELDFSTITKVEKVLAFPSSEGIEDVNIDSFNGILIENIKLAVELGELPPNIDFMRVLILLGSLFYGVPITLKNNNQQIMDYYSFSLSSLWEILRKSDNIQ